MKSITPGTLLYTISFEGTDSDKIPNSIGICALFWLTMVNMFEIFLFALCYYLMATPIAFMFGHIPVSPINYVRRLHGDRNIYIWKPVPFFCRKWYTRPIIIIFMLLEMYLGLQAAFGVETAKEPFVASLLITAWGLGIYYGCVVVECLDRKICGAIRNSLRNMKQTSSLSTWSMIVLAYRGWKEKFCPLIKIEK